MGSEFIDMVSPLQPRLSRVKNYISLETSFSGITSLHDLFRDSFRGRARCSGERGGAVPHHFIRVARPVLPVAPYTQGRNIENTRTKAIQIGAEPGDKHIMILPLFHIGGYSHFWAFFYMGGSNVLMPQRSFDPASTLQSYPR